jgi:hypothetical protein
MSERIFVDILAPDQAAVWVAAPPQTVIRISE